MERVSPPPWCSPPLLGQNIEAARSDRTVIDEYWLHLACPHHAGHTAKLDPSEGRLLTATVAATIVWPVSRPLRFFLTIRSHTKRCLAVLIFGPSAPPTKDM